MKRHFYERAMSLLMALVMLLALTPVFTVEAEAATGTALNYVAVTSELSADVPALVKTELQKSYQTVNMTSVAAKDFTAGKVPASGTVFVTVDIGSDYFGTNIAERMIAGATSFDQEKTAFANGLDSILSAIFGKNPDAHVVVVGVTNPMAGLYAETDAIGQALQNSIAQANEYAQSGSEYAWKCYYSAPAASVHNYAQQLIDAQKANDMSRVDANMEKKIKAMIRTELEAHPDFAYGIYLLQDEKALKALIDKKLDEMGGIYASLKSAISVDSKAAEVELEKALTETVNEAFPGVIKYFADVMNNYKMVELNKVKQINSQAYRDRVWDEMLPGIISIASKKIEPAVRACLSSRLLESMVEDKAIEMLHERIGNPTPANPFTKAEKPLENFYLRFLFEDGLFAKPDAKGVQTLCDAVLKTAVATELTLKSGEPENFDDCDVQISAAGKNFSNGMKVFVDGIVDADAKVTLNGNQAAITVTLPVNDTAENVTHTISFGGKSVSVTMPGHMYNDFVVEGVEAGDLVFAAQFDGAMKMKQVVPGTAAEDNMITLPSAIKSGEGWIVFVLDQDTYAPECAKISYDSLAN